MLSVTDHSRDSAGLVYVYPVVSRRAGGVSVGINLNTNNACNWACIYCQVPLLTRGSPPPVDLERLRDELLAFLRDVVCGDYLVRQVPLEAQRLVDVSFSGNGEPTSSPEFLEAVQVVEAVLKELNLVGDLKLRLITNGSFMHRDRVRRAVARIGALNGEVWFKLDRATEAGVRLVNRINTHGERTLRALRQCAGLAPTWVQTCYFAIDGREANEAERVAYLRMISALSGNIRGVQLYGLARSSQQPDAHRLSPLAPERFLHFADRISGLGVEVVAIP